MEHKKILLIGGGGTLGTYTADELLRLGFSVDIICPEEKLSNNSALRFYREYATQEFLEKLLSQNRYDGIVNFIHYTSLEAYKPIHRLLSANTEHLIFLSSYRVYADLQHPITETAPQLYDVVSDEDFLENEDYAVPKSKCERFIREESNKLNWTVVRPVISFSERRFDIVFAHLPETIKNHITTGKPLLLPEVTKNITAGLDWAKNSGKLIANLLLKEKALGEAFTVSSAQNLKWCEVADMYTEFCGIKFQWIKTEEYYRDSEKLPWIFKYDRVFDRKIDNSKILGVTGLNACDFSSINEGIKTELSKIK